MTLHDLHRRISILEGKPDPGVPCPNPECRAGRVDVAEDRWKTKWTACPMCKGARVVYPEEGL